MGIHNKPRKDQFDGDRLGGTIQGSVYEDDGEVNL